MNRRLYRSPDDRVLAGVAGGMAEAYEMDPAVVRIVWALLILFTGGIFLILYIVMAVVVPLRPAGYPGPWDQGTLAWSSTPPASPSGVPGDMPPADGTGTVTTPDADTTASPAFAAPPAAPPPQYRRPAGSPATNNGPIVIGAILIVVGALFLLRQYVNIDFGQLWPIIVIVVGLVLVISAFTRTPGRT